MQGTLTLPPAFLLSSFSAPSSSVILKVRLVLLNSIWNGLPFALIVRVHLVVVPSFKKNMARRLIGTLFSVFRMPSVFSMRLNLK